MLVSALPPVLVLNLRRFRYDAAAGGITKIIQFEPDLEIPLVISDVIPPNAQSNRITSSTITANLQATGTIRSMFFTRTETATKGSLAVHR
ncbi:hypothetical protein BGY98DRAFT_1185711 [Russula aff. rugulosa BPL654]|nr:hypothetical protein BGY98DRAFT_1185711 [Russula aff. rugulosa BPL654]